MPGDEHHLVQQPQEVQSGGFGQDGQEREEEQEQSITATTPGRQHQERCPTYQQEQAGDTMEPTHLLTELGAMETGSKDDLQGRHTSPCMEQTSTNEEVISSSHGTLRDQPTGRGGDPPGLSMFGCLVEFGSSNPVWKKIPQSQENSRDF